MSAGPAADLPSGAGLGTTPIAPIGPVAQSLDTRGNKFASSPRRRQKTRVDRAIYEAARQARRAGQSRAIASSYDAIGEGERAERIRSCGRLAVYVCATGCGAAHGRSAYHCRDRLCPYCAVLRGHQLADGVLPLVAAMAGPLFLTLTVRNGPDLAERGRHLRRAFEKLRRRKIWRDHIVGGIAIEEVTHNGATWHPHLHLVIDSDLPAPVLQAQIKAVWAALTGDSFIIDVRHLTGDDLAAAVREACKYTAKLASIVHDPALVAEFMSYAAHRRMVVPFGSCYGSAALDVADSETPVAEVVSIPAQPCPSCGSVGTLHRALGRGWTRAEAIAIGDGWYVLGRSPAAWAAVLASRRARS